LSSYKVCGFLLCIQALKEKETKNNRLLLFTVKIKMYTISKGCILLTMLQKPKVFTIVFTIKFRKMEIAVFFALENMQK